MTLYDQLMKWWYNDRLTDESDGHYYYASGGIELLGEP